MAVVIRYETATTARWALPFIVGASLNDTITVAVWTGFHVPYAHVTTPRHGRSLAFADPAVANSFAAVFDSPD
ncbi:MAG: hypothetical protein WA445_14135 [Pseudolabrys sp.]|jgi:hypothetical protein